MATTGDRRATLLAVAVVLALLALRLHAFVAGGTLDFRDAAFFFVPWREAAARTIATGAFPFWLDEASNGRALAADPNGGVFWPLSPLVLAGGTTALMLANAALLLAAFVLAARRAGLAAAAAASGAAVLLFSGVFQTLPVLLTTLASAAPIPILLASFGVRAPDARSARAQSALGGAALGLSLLGGEPVIALQGAIAALVLVLVRAWRERETGVAARRALAVSATALALGAGVAAVQVVPAAGELGRSARRAAMKAEEGALYWSVPPGRLLTLLEPRLAGDPMSEDPAGYWGAAASDAGLPYFPDVAFGLLPLALAVTAARDARGRGALLVAAAAAFVSFGRYVPGLGSLLARAPVLRYPEKWWLLATLAVAFASAVGVHLQLGRTERARSDLRRAALAIAIPAGSLALLAWVAPGALKALLWGSAVGGGAVPAARIAEAVGPPLLLGAASLVVVAWLASDRPRGDRLLLAALGVLFVADGVRRVAGTLPAGPKDRWSREPAAARLARALARDGRFFDDGADRRETAERRALERGGFDPLRPVAAAAWGLRYAGNNDVDRMMPAASVRAARDLAALPWGEEKVRRLEAMGVRLVRTPAPGPDPPGVREVGREGLDRLVLLERARPEFALESGEPVRVLERSSSRLTLRARVDRPVSLLMARTFDPNWRASVDGAAARIEEADLGLSRLALPAGAHEITLAYRNPLFGVGLVFSLASAAGLGLLAMRRAPA